MPGGAQILQVAGLEDAAEQASIHSGPTCVQTTEGAITQDAGC
jgi:hypothetical protein